jgi:hypothetical protein
MDAIKETVPEGPCESSPGTKRPVSIKRAKRLAQGGLITWDRRQPDTPKKPKSFKRPSRDGRFLSISRHFVPGCYHRVPPGTVSNLRAGLARALRSGRRSFCLRRLLARSFRTVARDELMESNNLSGASARW